MPTQITNDHPINSLSCIRTRIKNGWQCPECYGVQIDARQSRFEARPHGYLCTECGCQWPAA